MLASGGLRLDRAALGPKLGQCCGGAVTLLTEVFGAAGLASAAGAEIPLPLVGRVGVGRAPPPGSGLPPSPDPSPPGGGEAPCTPARDGVAAAGLLQVDGAVFARPLDARPMPLAVKRLLAAARGQGVAPRPQLVQGWFVEPVARPDRQLWLWGAGHVGRALVSVLAPLPGLAITWVDVGPERFPDALAENVRALPVADPALAVVLAPAEAEHLVLTFSHALDLELCHRLLSHGFAGAGLIGSATKWARFRSRLAALGHRPDQIARITCPIGNPALGKHPQAIAIGVASAFLTSTATRLQQERLG